MSNIGYGKTKKEIPAVVKEILDQTSAINSKFQSNLPSDSWIYSFLKRHPDLSCRIPEGLGQLRASVTKDVIVDWFKVLRQFIKNEFDINAESFFSDGLNGNRIYNLDETGK